jgi:hypothetical protein
LVSLFGAEYQQNLDRSNLAYTKIPGPIPMAEVLRHTHDVVQQ